MTGLAFDLKSAEAWAHGTYTADIRVWTFLAATLCRRGVGGGGGRGAVAGVLLPNSEMPCFFVIIIITLADEDSLVARFRANLVIDGGHPFDEDTWTGLRCGGIDVTVSHPVCPSLCLSEFLSV